MVCHGGAGTTAGALLHGLAVLVVPGPAPSQQAAAARVDAAGLGRHLPWDDASPVRLAAALLQLVGPSGARARAASARAALGALPGPDEVVGLLERAAGG